MESEIGHTRFSCAHGGMHIAVCTDWVFLKLRSVRVRVDFYDYEKYFSMFNRQHSVCGAGAFI